MSRPRPRLELEAGEQLIKAGLDSIRSRSWLDLVSISARARSRLEGGTQLQSQVGRSGGGEKGWIQQRFSTSGLSCSAAPASWRTRDNLSTL